MPGPGLRTALIAALLAVATAGLTAAPAMAGTFMVTTTNDTGTGSLRQAITDATSGDTIVVPASTSHYSISSDQLTISKSVTIVGGGARGAVIDAGNGTHRVLEITGGTVSISGVTITGGNTNDMDNGGGILLDAGAALTLSRSLVTGNTVEPFWSGGGIYTSTGATLTTDSSTISNNAARYGGGLYLNGTTTITNSTISGNQAGSNGTAGDGGGLQNNSTLTLTNDTIADNQASDSGGGGGIYGGASAVSNTIVAGNTDSVLGVDNCATRFAGGTVTSTGPNLENGSDCAFGAHGGIGGVAAKLGPLANNGGPTDTHALLSGSPAIDSASAADCPATDQRGGARPQPPGGKCDIGAFEYGSLADLAVSVTVPAKPVTVGGTMTYTLTATNNGPDPATGVRLQDTPPSAAAVVSSVASQGSCGGTPPVMCALGTLTSGAVATVTVTVRPTHAGTASESATVSGDPTDPTLANNQADFQTTVKPALPPPPVALRLTHVAQSRRTWRAGNALAQTSRRTKTSVGTTFSFTLNVAARARLVFTQIASGRLVAGKCVPVAKRNAGKHRCTRRVAAGMLSFAAHSGNDHVRFEGRLSRRKRLSAGRYSVVITATSSTGHASSKPLSFTIVK